MATLKPRLPRERVTLLALLVAAAACSPPPPPDVAFVDEWRAVAAAVTASAPDARSRARITAYGAIAMHEAFAAEQGTPLRSLAGQVNALWNVPVPGGELLDGAVVAAEAQRAVFDSLLASDAAARAMVDSLAARQIAARRKSGVSERVAARSRAHALALARSVLATATAEGARTLVLRHPDECALASPKGDAPVMPQGEPTPDAPAASAPEVAASYVVEAIARADALAASRGSGRVPVDACVGQRVRGRVQTRIPPA